MGCKEYTVFHSDGSCKCKLSTPVSSSSLIPSDGEIIVKGDHRGKILVGGQIIDKPVSRITIIGTKLNNLPDPTEITIKGNGAIFRRTITDGVYEFSIDVPGEYTVKCESKVELPIEFKINIYGEVKC